jgi:hypothetical protein
MPKYRLFPHCNLNVVQNSSETVERFISALPLNRKGISPGTISDLRQKLAGGIYLPDISVKERDGMVFSTHHCNHFTYSLRCFCRFQI